MVTGRRTVKAALVDDICNQRRCRRADRLVTDRSSTVDRKNTPSLVFSSVFAIISKVVTKGIVQLDYTKSLKLEVSSSCCTCIYRKQDIIGGNRWRLQHEFDSRLK